MGLWRDILRALGLTNDTRVHISAPGIDVVITGQPEQVHQLLGVVKHELERASRRAGEGRWQKVPDSQVVRPTELDEMDSPYALPEAMVMPVREEESTTGEVRRPDRIDDDTLDQPYESESEDRIVRAGADDLPTAEVRAFREEQAEAATMLPADDPVKQDGPPRGTPIPPDDEATRLTETPSRGTSVPSEGRRQAFVTDGGPTLMPSESDVQGTDPEVVEVSDSDRSA